MIEFSSSLAAGWLPHGYCLAWNPALMTALVSSDTLIALSYFSIPVALGIFYRSQRRGQFGELILLFALFIFACGLTHLLAVVNVWRPMYLLTAVVKAATALISVVTAVTLWPLLPRVSAFIQAHRKRSDELERLNRKLQDAARQLELSETRFRQTFENAPIGLALVNMDWRIEQLNQSLCSMLGYELTELKAASLLDLLVPDERERVRAQLQAMRDGGPRSCRAETRMETKTDGVIDITIDGVLQSADEDATAHLLVQVRDVTVSNQLAELRERTAAELRDLYDRAPCGYHSLDAEGRFIRINDTELRWLGYTREEVVGKLLFTDLLDDAGRRTFEREFPRFVREGAIKDIEFDVRTRHGPVISVLISATAIYDANGRFKMSRSTMYDVTTQRQALNALRDNENYLQQLLDNLPVSVVVHRPDTSIEFANPAAESLLGLTHDQLMGRQAPDPAWHFCREDRSAMPVEEFPVSVVLETRRPLAEYVVGIVTHADEEPRWAYVHAFPETDPAGHIQRVIVSFFDISERRALEARLRELATTDELTGIANRRAFRERALQELHRARRKGSSLALLLFDIDHFKQINDSFGHEAGDRIIQSVADAVAEQIREIDVLGRWGGEEYVVLLPDTSRTRGVEIAERLRAAVEGASVDVDGRTLRCTISVGVADVAADDEYGLDDIVQRADVAMYAAKTQGRNRVMAYSGDLADMDRIDRSRRDRGTE